MRAQRPRNSGRLLLLHGTSTSQTGEEKWPWKKEVAGKKRLRLMRNKSFQQRPSCFKGVPLLRINPRDAMLKSEHTVTREKSKGHYCIP